MGLEVYFLFEDIHHLAEYSKMLCEKDEAFKEEVLEILERIETAARNAKLKLGE